MSGLAGVVMAGSESSRGGVICVKALLGCSTGTMMILRSPHQACFCLTPSIEGWGFQIPSGGWGVGLGASTCAPPHLHMNLGRGSEGFERVGDADNLSIWGYLEDNTRGTADQSG
eukprot:758799-Hanusia_phi.AAC.1